MIHCDRCFRECKSLHVSGDEMICDGCFAIEQEQADAQRLFDLIQEMDGRGLTITDDDELREALGLPPEDLGAIFNSCDPRPFPECEEVQP